MATEERPTAATKRTTGHRVPMPWVGALVHYRSYGTPGGEFLPECRAAIVAGLSTLMPDELDELRVDLVVFNPQGLFFNRVPYSGHARGGTWHYIDGLDNPRPYVTIHEPVPEDANCG